MKQTRRALLVQATAASVVGCATAQPLPPSEGERVMTDTRRMPGLYVPHGGGPWPFVELGFGDPSEYARLATYLRGIGAEAPRAILVISAHWEAPVFTVMTSPRPPMLYDYYGFPPASYEITWPAPGDPALASRVRGLLTDAGFETAEDPARGFDHGTFVPLKLAFPDASVPTVQLSLKAGLDPEMHLAVGRALRPLRDEGVLIIGSGMSFHNMRAFRTGGGEADANRFDRWLQETVALPEAERDARLRQWASAPGGRGSHPREEHLLPLMVVAGASDEAGTIPFSDRVLGVPVSAARFG